MVVMDNLAVHKAKKVTPLFDQSFQAFFLPPYSCTLNPIEHLWLVIKQAWRRQMHTLAMKTYETEDERIRDIKSKITQIIGKL